MTGIFHACLEFMNRKIGLIPFLKAVFVNKHVKNSLFDKIEESVSECALLMVEGAETASLSIKRPGPDPWWTPPALANDFPIAVKLC